MKHLVIRVAISALGLYVANYFVSGFLIAGGWKEYLLAGLVLGLLNMTVRPILKLISFPLIVLTLGFFTFVINMAILWSVDYLFASVTILNLTALAWATLVVSLVNVIFSHFNN